MIGARFALNVPQARKSFWAQPMVLLRDVGQVETRFGPLGDSVNLDARYVHGLHRTHHRLRNHFEPNVWYSYVTWVKWKLVSVHLEIVCISMPDRCTVSAKCTMGMQIILGTPDGTPR